MKHHDSSLRIWPRCDSSQGTASASSSTGQKESREQASRGSWLSKSCCLVLLPWLEKVTRVVCAPCHRSHTSSHSSWSTGAN